VFAAASFNVLQEVAENEMEGRGVPPATSGRCGKMLPVQRSNIL
jgi:hypothetical protein